MRVETPHLSEEVVPETSGNDGETIVASSDGDKLTTSEFKPKTFKNRFLNFVRFGSVINGAAETFFKSEIRRRLFVTAVLIVISRVGYFIPLPGFDRRLIPKDYMSFVSGSSVGKLHYITYILQSTNTPRVKRVPVSDTDTTPTLIITLNCVIS
jgi:hypothetical protein